MAAKCPSMEISTRVRSSDICTTRRIPKAVNQADIHVRDSRTYIALNHGIHPQTIDTSLIARNSFASHSECYATGPPHTWRQRWAGPLAQ